MSATGNKRATTGRTDWETPQPLFDLLDREFRFTLDAAASDANHKCERYLTETENALEAMPEGEVIFVNPPYGRLSAWAAKFWDWSETGNTVVALLPANTDTGWFAFVCDSAEEVRLLTGRVQFVGGNSNTGGSMVAVYRPKNPAPCNIYVWDWRAEL